ncbi:MAG: type II toxin-antitoxin system Phd/YefM family antitoxin [Alphaproteobacteria bacterium]|nr:type II toxin-antitoxin system Phd/YefM family antitoxin [Alphaproteobacteria bacterium]MBF0334666.1 type II toxin-antitoxin system Phd/YefM family antitoxin [Alphaproteobacteria bacterium]MBF0374458.1 type II toxin-antitoxin system Phd/YefM family antitoxin [Alphaproteobacteria bacterium]MBF0393448.1 type II toxin-antitoxin system Phd/YefM family antitoxin [Alphaproteobacteria bacterium]
MRNDGEWQFEEAQANLGEVVLRAEQEGAQHILNGGRRVAVLLSPAEHERLSRPAGNLVDFMRNSPFGDAAAEGVEFAAPPADPRRNVDY